MTSSEIIPHAFDRHEFAESARRDKRYANWPVVYVIDGAPQQKPSVYVGETLNVASRIDQHQKGGQKDGLDRVRVVMNDRFNKSACLDLESHLIRWFAGDGQFDVLNRNEGITSADYFDRASYRESFLDVFEQLKDAGLFTRSVSSIENDDLFKLSPFKALTWDQSVAVENILDDLFAQLHDESDVGGLSIIQGAPGTGKTVVAIFLIKLLADIRNWTATDDVEPDSIFSDLFVAENRNALQDFRVAFVIPQQSLRASVKNVFRKTPLLDPNMVMDQWQVAKSDEHFDLVIVDEAHRLNQRASQSSAARNREFTQINIALFGADNPETTQLDWLRAKSTRQLLMLDPMQSVRPADLSFELTNELLREARSRRRHYPLATQMRVAAGTDYVEFIRSAIRGDGATLPELSEYDFRIFDDLGAMRAEIMQRDAEHGLSRLVAGYAWKWASKKDRTATDIRLDGIELQWNQTDKDWINSPTSLQEVGSIHTVQGYDLNYAGVIIGPDLRLDPETGHLVTRRDWIHDAKGKQNNAGRKYTEAELLEYITNIYAVLLTRGIRGTYVYAVDPGVRRMIHSWVQQVSSS